MYRAAAEGSSFPVMLGWTSGPVGNIYHRLEQPSFRNFQNNDVLFIEIEGRWGGYVGRTDQSFFFGSAPEEYKIGMEMTIASFNQVQSAMKPGVTVGDIIEAGIVKGMGGQGEASLTMHGYGTGDEGPLVTGSRAPDLLSLEMKEGACMLIKPSCKVNGQAGFGNWGDTVIVRKNGAERLGTRLQELIELS